MNLLLVIVTKKVAKAVVENTIAKLDTVTEGYVGKTANLVKIEELFNDIIADVYRTAGEGASAMDRIYTARKMNINKDPRIEKIRQLYAKEFNFAKFDMTVASTKDPNAFTYVMSKFTRTSISKLPELLRNMVKSISTNPSNMYAMYSCILRYSPT